MRKLTRFKRQDGTKEFGSRVLNYTSYTALCTFLVRSLT